MKLKKGCKKRKGGKNPLTTAEINPPPTKKTEIKLEYDPTMAPDNCFLAPTSQDDLLNPILPPPTLKYEFEKLWPDLGTTTPFLKNGLQDSQPGSSAESSSGRSSPPPLANFDLEKFEVKQESLSNGIVLPLNGPLISNQGNSCENHSPCDSQHHVAVTQINCSAETVNKEIFNSKKVVPEKCNDSIQLFNSCVLNDDRKPGFLCKDCNQSFATIRSLDWHITGEHFDKVLTKQSADGHKYQEVVCEICELKFAMCNYCGKDFFSERSVKNHIRAHESKQLFVCVFCGLTLPRKEKESHLLTHGNVRPLCRSCHRLYEETMLPEEEVTVPDEIWKAAMADMKKRKPVLMLTRINYPGKKTDVNLETGQEQYNCHVGVANFAESDVLTKPMETHKDCSTESFENTLIQCQRSKKSVASVESSLTPVGGDVQSTETSLDIICEICDRVFTEHNLLEEHMNMHMEFETLQQSSQSPKKSKITVKVKDEYFDPGFGVESRDLANGSPGRKDNLQTDDSGIGFTSDNESLNEIYLEYCDDKPQGEANSTSEGESYDCEVCCQRFKKLIELSNHMKIHMGESENEPGGESKIDSGAVTFRDCSCQICGTDFEDPWLLMRHTKEHIGVMPNDTETNNAIYVVEDEEKEKSEPVHICGLCDAEFSDPAVLSNHTKAHIYSNPFTCKVCEMGFTRETALQRHMASHTMEDNNKETEPLVIEYQYLCKFCKHLFSNRDGFKRHLKFDCAGKPFRCKLCTERFFTEAEVKSHTDLHSKMKNNPLRCETCGKQFIVKEVLKRHKLYCKKTEKSKEPKFAKSKDPKKLAEEVNNSESKSNDVVARPLPAEAPMQLNTKSPGKPSPTKIVTTATPTTCLVAKKKKRYTCEKCGRTFAYHARYQKHLTEIHFPLAYDSNTTAAPGFGFVAKKLSFDRKYLCIKCGKKFAYNARYKKHMAETHPEECASTATAVPDARLVTKKLSFDRKYSCKKCGRVFAYQARFQQHLTERHGLKTLPQNSKFSCKKCSRKFSYQAHFLRHVRNHQRSRIL